MQTLIIDILNHKAERLLEDLESLQLIRVRKERRQTPSVINWAGKTKDSIKENLNSFEEKLAAKAFQNR